MRSRLYYAFIIMVGAFCIIIINNQIKINELQRRIQTGCNEVVNNVKEKSDKNIELTFDMWDIYRIDITCEYITRDLGIAIDHRYQSKKKCALAKPNYNADNMLHNSIKYPISSYIYEPIFNLKNQIRNIFENQSYLLENIVPIEDNPILKGGFWAPQLTPGSECGTNDIEFVVFIVPFMNRYENLNFFIVNLHNYLRNSRKAQFSYTIIVAEQQQNTQLFNKGQIINTAVKFAIDKYKERLDCIVIHDVDLVPLLNDSSIDYRCKLMPNHLSNRVFIMKNKWDRFYNKFLTGGIISLTPQHFVHANGFSSRYAGWGAEDDDWTLRMFNKGLCVMRPEFTSVPYAMLTHGQATANKQRMSHLSGAIEFQDSDGLSNIDQHTKIISEKSLALFKHLVISVNLVV